MTVPPEQTPCECVDPRIGDQIWRLEEPDLSPGLRAELSAHVSVCHACRALLHLDGRVRLLARSGGLSDPAPAWRDRWLRVPRPRVAWAPGLALAACLVLIALMPPRPITHGLSERGADRIRFLRPAEGEVLATQRPWLRWTPIAGASRYFVEIRDAAGRSLWKGGSDAPALRVPADVSLVQGGTYKAMLATQPADLVDPGRTSVVFRTDSLWRAALHRLRWTHPVLQWIGGLALGLMLFMRLRRAGFPL